jgi:hypothetical protein
MGSDCQKREVNGARLVVNRCRKVVREVKLDSAAVLKEAKRFVST